MGFRGFAGQTRRLAYVLHFNSMSFCFPEECQPPTVATSVSGISLGAETRVPRTPQSKRYCNPFFGFPPGTVAAQITQSSLRPYLSGHQIHRFGRPASREHR